MSDSLRKIVVFLLVGAGAFALAFGLGRMVGEEKEPVDHEKHAGHAESSYTVDLAGADGLQPDKQELRFSVLADDGERVTAYDVVHEKKLHLIVVDRNDPRVYAHLHPTMSDGGVWGVPTTFGPGDYRLYADTKPADGAAQVLTADFTVTGAPVADEKAVFTPNDTATVDGFEVALEADGSAYTFTVTKAGQPVELEPYLGAGGHLVGVRAETLDYLHAHALDAEGNTVGFHVEAPRSGTWVLHLDFQVDGSVHDATFVQRLEADGPGSGMGEHMQHMDEEETEGDEHHH